VALDCWLIEGLGLPLTGWSAATPPGSLGAGGLTTLRSLQDTGGPRNQPLLPPPCAPPRPLPRPRSQRPGVSFGLPGGGGGGGGTPSGGGGGFTFLQTPTPGAPNAAALPAGPFIYRRAPRGAFGARAHA
jgi:hypothetical protein